jgi:hypothetical protein
MITFSSLLTPTQEPEPHQQKVIVRRGQVIAELGFEAKTDTN